MFGSAESEHPRLTNVELFPKNCNLCDHNPPTLQTDRGTDRQTDDIRPQEEKNKIFCNIIGPIGLSYKSDTYATVEDQSLSSIDTAAHCTVVLVHCITTCSSEP